MSHQWKEGEQWGVYRVMARDPERQTCDLQVCDQDGKPVHEIRGVPADALRDLGIVLSLSLGREHAEAVAATATAALADPPLPAGPAREATYRVLQEEAIEAIDEVAAGEPDVLAAAYLEHVCQSGYDFADVWEYLSPALQESILDHVAGEIRYRAE